MVSLHLSTGSSGDHRRNKRTQGEIYHDLVVPLMVYEEQYPAFGEILVLVLDRFPLEGFLGDDQFEKALRFLCDGYLHTAMQCLVYAQQLEM